MGFSHPRKAPRGSCLPLLFTEPVHVPQGDMDLQGGHDLCFLCVDQSEVRTLLRRSTRLCDCKAGMTQGANSQRCLNISVHLDQDFLITSLSLQEARSSIGADCHSGLTGPLLTFAPPSGMKTLPLTCYPLCLVTHQHVTPPLQCHRW